jgi:hypothetical protein
MGSFVIHNEQAKNVISNDTEYNIVDILENSEQEQPYIANEIPSKPIYNISLAQEYQDLIYNLCEINDLSYELVLAVIYQESKFDSTSLNINKNGSRDVSLFQLNDMFLDAHREHAINYCQLSENVIFNPYNPEHNIMAGIGNIAYLRDYYSEKGVIDEDLITYISNGYNQGVLGYEKYVRQTGKISRSYSDKIYSHKEILETTNTLN